MTDRLVDTSVAVPLVVADHDDHRRFTALVDGSTLGLAGHAAFETFSVLTRLPAPLRRDPTTVARVLTVGFPGSVLLPPDRSMALITEFAALGIAGGSVYDALVAAAAAEAGIPLLSADRRAVEIYRRLNVEYELLA